MMKVGERYGNFLIQAEIGRGGMGTIYHAIDTMLNREVALKIIHPQLTDNDQLMERFKVEAMTQARMNHPHIVLIFSFNKFENDYVIAMEYVKGESLKELLIGKKRLDVGESVFYVRQILEGLRYAHAQHVIHRDIKPANILIDRARQVKLSDFGVAKIFGVQGLTKTGILVGTPWYTSPEQILGRDIDFRADLYSLGITFYEMLAGRVPFDSGTNSEFQIQKAHLETPPPRPSVFNPDIGLKLEKYILKALQKKVDKRFQSADEMLGELEDLERDIARATVAVTPPLTRPKPVAPPPAPGKGRLSPLRVAGSLILLLSGILLVGVLTGKLNVNTVKGARRPAPSTTATVSGTVSSTISTVNSTTTVGVPVDGGFGSSGGMDSREPRKETSIASGGVLGPSSVENASIPALNSSLRLAPPRSQILSKSPAGHAPAPEPEKTKETNPADSEARTFGSESKETDESLAAEGPVNLPVELLRLRNFMETAQLGKADRLARKLLRSHSGSKLFQLIGRIRFLQNRFADAEPFWVRTLEAGDWIDLGFVHRHPGGEECCSGQLRFRKKLIIFDSKTNPAHSLALRAGTIDSIGKTADQNGIRLRATISGRSLDETFTLPVRSGCRAQEAFLVDFIQRFVM